MEINLDAWRVAREADKRKDDAIIDRLCGSLLQAQEQNKALAAKVAELSSPAPEAPAQAAA